MVLENVLQPEIHARLISDLTGIASVAGIQPHFLAESMKKYCGNTEIEWVRNFKFYLTKGMPGLVLEGVVSPEIRCQAICAALLRNYIDARVVSLGALLEEGPVPTVLLVPNFHVSMVDKGLPAWKMQIAYDLILQRVARGKPSVLFIQNKELLVKNFGDGLAELLTQFKWVK